MPEMHHHRPRAKLLVAGAAPIVFPAADLIACRQDLALFLKRIGHDFVRLEVTQWLQLPCRIGADPLPSDAEVEKSDQHLSLDLPGSPYR
jgi:hypothetical protein